MPDLTDFIEEQEIQEALKSEEVHDAKVKLAAEAAEYARSISPVGGEHDPHPGRYRDSIVVKEEDEEVSVEFADPTANLIEYGSINNREYAVRARTAEHFNQ